MENLKKILKTPNNSCKPKVFWHWNDRLDRDTLMRQLTQMHKAGIGGCFVVYHADMQIQYTCDELCEFLSVCNLECEKLGMELYVTHTADIFTQKAVLDENSGKYCTQQLVSVSNPLTTAAKNLSNAKIGLYADILYPDKAWHTELEAKFFQMFGEKVSPEDVFGKNAKSETKIKYQKCLDMITAESAKDYLNSLKHDFGKIYAASSEPQVFPYNALQGVSEYASDPFENEFISTKTSRSAACRANAQGVMTLCNDRGGWNTSWKKTKSLYELQLAMGADTLAYHIPYSVKGDNKRQFCGMHTPLQPWWEQYDKINLYFSRLSQLMCGGKDTADILVVNPRYSYAAHDCFEPYYDLELITQLLDSIHIDHHLADDTQIACDAKAENGKLILGGCSYSVVFLPMMRIFDPDFTALMLEFANGGGRIFCSEDAVVPDELKNSVYKTGFDEEQLLTLTIREKLANVKIISRDGNADNICCRCRDYGNFKVYFFVNTASSACDARIYINGENSAVRLKLQTLSDIRLSAIDYPQGTAFRLSFAPHQSHIVLVAHEGTLPEGTKTDKPATIVKLKSDWEIEECGINALTLDRCRIQKDGELSEEVSVLRALNDIDGKYEAHFSFEIDEAMSLKSCENMRLVIEDAMEHEIFVNGRRVFYNGYSWWRDSAFEVIDIKDFAVKGTNNIVVTGDTKQSKSLESIYIIGNFGVYSRSAFIRTRDRAVMTDGPFVISNPSSNAFEGKLAEAGMPFFTGRILLTQSLKIKKSFGERIYLDFDTPNAALGRLYINSAPAYDISTADFPLDITAFVKRGSNKLSLELIIPCRNLLGPHHFPDGEPLYTHSNDFDDNTHRYCFTDAGI